MKYTYAYKTSDGVRHEESMDSESREAVFAALRKQGIKAIKVVAADGSKANGEIRGIRKRIAIGSVALAAVVAACITYLYLDERGNAIGSSFSDMTRRQVIGDVGIIDKGIVTGWSDVFELEGDRFLASFAIPGVPAGQRNTSESELRRALDSKLAIKDSDTIEARQIKAMVQGMKQELRAYLDKGGTIVGYGKRLVKRQEAEIAIYERVKAEVENAKKNLNEADFMALWEQRNSELRNLGIRLVNLD